MVLNRGFLVLSLMTCVVSCVSLGVNVGGISDVYVSDFHSKDMTSCGPSDVDLGHHEAREFFIRSRQVEYRVIHDNYNHAPCYLEGVLKQGPKVCEWEIRAGATGLIRCGDEVRHFVCDTCDDLFSRGK